MDFLVSLLYVLRGKKSKSLEKFKIFGEFLVFVTSNTGRTIGNNANVCNSKKCHKYKQIRVKNEDTQNK